MLSLFDDARYSDLTVKFGTESVKAHKLVLVQSLEYFDKLIGGGFKASRGLSMHPQVIHADFKKEGRKDEVELAGDDPVAVRAMLRFLCNLDYDRTDNFDQDSPDAEKWQKLCTHAHVYAAAEKYNIEALRQTVAGNMADLLDTDFERADLLSALNIIWTSTVASDVHARPLFARFCAEELPSLSESDLFKKILRETELGTDVLLVLAGKPRITAMRILQCGCTGTASVRCSTCSRFSRNLILDEGFRRVPMYED